MAMQEPKEGIAVDPAPRYCWLSAPSRKFPEKSAVGVTPSGLLLVVQVKREVDVVVKGKVLKGRLVVISGFS